MKQIKLRNLILASLFVAIGFVLPYITAENQMLGNLLLPMHLPIFLCGFICGPVYGLAAGLVTPLLRSLIVGMPPLFPTALSMSAELAVYGLATGLFYKYLPKKNYVTALVSLVCAMLAGRIVWGAASLLLLGLAGKPFGFQAFLAGAFINALPGIVLQIVFIPALIFALEKAKLLDK